MVGILWNKGALGAYGHRFFTGFSAFRLTSRARMSIYEEIQRCQSNKYTTRMDWIRRWGRKGSKINKSKSIDAMRYPKKCRDVLATTYKLVILL